MKQTKKELRKLRLKQAWKRFVAFFIYIFGTPEAKAFMRKALDTIKEDIKQHLKDINLSKRK